MWATTFHKLLRDVYGDFDQLVDTIFFLCDMPCLDDVQTKALASAAGVTLGDVVEVYVFSIVYYRLLLRYRFVASAGFAGGACNF